MQHESIYIVGSMDIYCIKGDTILGVECLFALKNLFIVNGSVVYTTKRQKRVGFLLIGVGKTHPIIVGRYPYSNVIKCFCSLIDKNYLQRDITVIDDFSNDSRSCNWEYGNFALFWKIASELSLLSASVKPWKFRFRMVQDSWYAVTRVVKPC